VIEKLNLKRMKILFSALMAFINFPAVWAVKFHLLNNLT